MSNQAFPKIWIVVIALAIIAGGFFTWQYFWKSKEEMPPQPPEENQALIEYNKEGLPKFENFPVSEKFEVVPVKVDYSNPTALTFYTKITEGAKQAPNFAGHYTIIEWGCGTSCRVGVVFDAKTGKIYNLPLSELGLEFRIDSNLLIVNPPKIIEEVYGSWEIPPEWLYSAYYKWENNQFINIYDTRTAK